jgi:erythromycin esterase-like protein
MKQPQNTDIENEIAEITKNNPLTGELILPEPILADLARKKVIGFGETVHGSLETDKFIYNNIRQLITDHNCRLVLFEMNIDRVALYNQYINGFTIDTTDTPLKFLSYEFEKFIKWLKEYNATHSAKVNVAGIDLHSNPLSSNPIPPYINGFIKSFNSNSPKVDTLLQRINSGRYRRIPLKYAMDNEKELSSEFGKFNYQILKHILLSRTDSALVPPKFNIQVYFYWQQVHRDYTLWQNTKGVLKEFADGKSPVVICAHYAHLDKVSSIHFNEVTTLGQYLNQYYKDAYCHIGVILGEGQAGVMKGGNPVYYSLESPIKGSLEYLAMQTNQNYFYRKGYINSKIPMTIRRLGNSAAASQFIPAYFKGSMNSFIFIRKSSPLFK